MGAAAYARGSRCLARGVAADHAAAAERGAYRGRLEDDNAALRERVSALESELKRARRCIALGRYAHEERMREASEDRASSAFAIETLTKLAKRLGAPGFDDTEVGA